MDEWIEQKKGKEHLMLFTDIQAAFEEMEFLAKTTGRTHLLMNREKNGYRVVEAGCQGTTGEVIAELNCRNVIGESEINQRRGYKLKQRVVSLDKKRKVV